MCSSEYISTGSALNISDFAIERMNSRHLAQVTDFTNQNLMIKYPSKFFLQFVYGTNMFCYIVFSHDGTPNQLEFKGPRTIVGIVSGKVEQKLQYNSEIGGVERYRQGHIYTLIVDPDYRGQGMGKDLLKYAIDRIRCTGSGVSSRGDNGNLNKIVVDVLLEYKSLLKKRNGWIPLPDDADPLIQDNETYELIMRSNGIVKFYEKLGFTYERRESTLSISSADILENITEEVLIRKDEYMGVGDGLKMIMVL